MPAVGERSQRTPGRVTSRLGAAFDRLLDACAWLACALLLFQVATVCIDVILRDFADMSFLWITASNEWSLVYVAFLGAGWLEREGGHTRDDSMLEGLGPGAKVFSDWLSLGLGVVVCVFLVWYGTTVTWAKYTTNVYDFFKLPNVPIYWVYLIIPLGSLLWLIQLLRNIAAYVGKSRRDKAASRPATEEL
jgi:TRAP-type C4-dicarboxylate transport system permease small subunit